MTLISNIKDSLKKNTEPNTRLYLIFFMILWSVCWYCSFRRDNKYLNTLLIAITVFFQFYVFYIGIQNFSS